MFLIKFHNKCLTVSCPCQHKLVKRNQKLYNPDSPLLIGEVVMEVNEYGYIDMQQRLV